MQVHVKPLADTLWAMPAGHQLGFLTRLLFHLHMYVSHTVHMHHPGWGVVEVCSVVTVTTSLVRGHALTPAGLKPSLGPPRAAPAHGHQQT